MQHESVSALQFKSNYNLERLTAKDNKRHFLKAALQKKTVSTAIVQSKGNNTSGLERNSERKPCHTNSV